MSSFLCTPRHIALLAAYVATDRWAQYQCAEDNAEVLARANVANLVRAYRSHYDQSHPEDDAAGGSLKDFIHACRAEAGRLAQLPRPSNAVSVIKQAECFEYQSCDAPEWEGSVARRLIDACIASAHRALPGYDAIPWGI